MVRYKLPCGIKNRKFVVILLLFLIIFLSAALFVVYISPAERENLKAVISDVEGIYRVNEEILFEANKSKGNIKIYLWEFGDGNNSTQSYVRKTYDNPGWYNISLTIFDENNKNDTSIIKIGIQIDDSSTQRELTRLIWWGQGYRGTYIQLPIGPNIGNPNVTTTISIDGAFGRIGLTIYLIEEGRFSEFYSEEFSVNGGVFSYNFNIASSSLPSDIQHNSVSIQLFLWIDNGKWRDGIISMDCSFPV